MIRLGRMGGTKRTFQTPLIALLDNNRFQLNAVAMEKLKIKEGARIDVILDPETDTLFIGVVPEKEGLSISKTGKVQDPLIYSWLTDSPEGKAASFEILEETVDFSDILWNKITRFTVPQEENVEPTEVETTIEEDPQNTPEIEDTTEY